MSTTRTYAEQRESLWKKARQSGMTRRRFLSLLGAGGVGAVLAACGQQTAETPRGTSTATSQAPAATPKPTRGKELNLALDTFGADILDPTMMTSGAAKNMMEPMYDGFIGLETDGKVVPKVFTSWKVSDDHLTWTFEMRKGIKFHGGAGEATAEDAKFSFERYLLPEGVYATKWATILDKAEVAGPYTLRVTTKTPQAGLLYMLCPQSAGPVVYLLPKKLIEENGIEAYRKQPIGTGPCQFKSYTAGSVVEFSAFDGYWGEPPGYDTYRAMLVPQENARIGLLRQGRAQVIILSPDGAQDVKAAGLDVLWAPGAAQAQFALFGTYAPSGQDKPAANIKVRQALSLAVNRKEMIDALLPGAELPSVPGVTIATAGIDHAKWLKVAQERYKYDVNEAKRLLAAAGYPNGFEITLYTYPLTGIPADIIGTAVAGYWEKVGVKVKVVNTDQAAFQPMRGMDPLPPQLMGQASTYRNSANPQLSSNMSSLVSSQNNVLRLLNTGLKTSAIPEVDDLIAASAAEFDSAKLEKINDDLLTKVADSWVVSPLATIATPFGADPNVAVKLRPITQIGPSMGDARPKK